MINPEHGKHSLKPPLAFVQVGSEKFGKEWDITWKTQIRQKATEESSLGKWIKWMKNLAYRAEGNLPGTLPADASQA